jgi:uridine kinase
MPTTRKTPLLVGVSGGSCSGKTTLVQALIERLGPHLVGSIQHDSYYTDLAHLLPSERAAVNYDHPDALETTLLIDHLEALRQGQPAAVPVYDFAHHVRAAATEAVQPREIIILEGILIYAVAALRAMLDMRIYVRTEPDIRLARRLQRDVAKRGRTVESVLRQYLATVRPGHIRFVKPGCEFADIVIYGADDNYADISPVIAKIKDMLGQP